MPHLGGLKPPFFKTFPSEQKNEIENYKNYLNSFEYKHKFCSI